MKVGFSIDMYDRDGERISECIMIHYEDKIMLKLDDEADLINLINYLESVADEIRQIKKTKTDESRENT
jgi:hypothetical protein